MPVASSPSCSTASKGDARDRPAALRRLSPTPANTSSSLMPPERSNVPVKLSLPLSYQQDIFTELRSEDELVILARGLGLLRLVTNLLHFYDAAGHNLVLVVGADDRENEWIGEALAEQYAISGSPLARGLKVINTERATVPMRERIYLEGGILSVTSRILIVDLLSKLLDPEKITGMVVLHAEK
ncbi:hypothetical protein MAP00_006586 [Monascus purpureus]|nr:hypothetical protein MAP00_006586 [Monascus purpureus]